MTSWAPTALRRSSGVRPALRAMRASAVGPISTPSWKAKTKSGQPGRLKVRGEPAWRRTVQPIRSNAERTRRALLDGQRLTLQKRDRGQSGGCQLAMIDAVGEHPQGERFRRRCRRLPRFAVDDHPRQINHLCEPAAVNFLFDFDRQSHGAVSVARHLKSVGPKRGDDA